MPTLTERIRSSYAERGFGGSVDAAVRYMINAARERRYDASAGLDTSGAVWYADEELAEAAGRHAEHYEGSPPRRFARIMAALPVDPAATTFIDLGCGKGRAVVLALEHGFRRVVGVEFLPELAAVGQENVRNAAARLPGVEQAEVVTGDAAAYGFPAGPLVVYLYNPFDAELMERVVANLAASLAAQPREAYVVYLNAHYTQVLDACPALTRRPDLEAPAAARPPRGLRGYLRYERGEEFPLAIYSHTAPLP